MSVNLIHVYNLELKLENDPIEQFKPIEIRCNCFHVLHMYGHDAILLLDEMQMKCTFLVSKEKGYDPVGEIHTVVQRRVRKEVLPS